MRKDDLGLVVMDGRHAGELLAHPCACGHHRCTLGEHLWRSTRDMAPGPRAQCYGPSTASGSPGDEDPPPDATEALHEAYRALLEGYWAISRDLARFIGRYRPDRFVPLPDPASDGDWCRHHLRTIGTCESRYRGDECRTCYDLRLAFHHLPDAELLRAYDRKGYLADQDVKAWSERLPRSARKRRKAS